MEKNLDVAILGGGIAGLATAISLRHLGMEVSVFERRRSVHNLGAGIVCWPNASFVLSELGVLDEISAVAGAVTTMRRTSKDGIELGSLDITRIDEAVGFPSLSILREDLMRILLQCAEKCGIPIRYESRAIKIENVGARSCVTFADGNSIFPDIIIGADGRMNSIARKYVMHENRPVFQGFINWIGIHQWDNTASNQMTIQDYWGVGARFGIVPVSQNTVYWAGGTVVKEADRDPSDQQISRLRRTFDGWPSPVSEIVLAASNSNTKLIPLYDHDPVPKWHRDNVLMIGDAAHAALPTSGQGAAQALEDAWFLSREFAASPGRPDNAMAEFTQKRVRKTAGIIMGGRALATALFNEDADACAVRDHNAMETDYSAMAAGMATGWSAGLPVGN